MKFLSVLALIAVTYSAALAEPVAIDGLQGLGDIRHHRIESEVIGKRYDVLVGLPDGYAESADLAYPAIYILDGAALYPLLQAYYRYLNFGGEVPDAILVAISYSDGDWVSGNDRSHDYTAPSDERELWGGAEKFRTFLASELLPLVESKYRARGDRRIIFGQSIGGQFVLFSAQTEPSLFWGHIASNPALDRNLPFFLGLHGSTATASSATKLFVGRSENDDARFLGPAVSWVDHWTARRDLPWQLKVDVLEGHNHYSAPPVSFRNGLKWLFADQPAQLSP